MRNLLKQQRLIDKLNTGLGPTILSYLADPKVLEINLNSDGRIWIKHQLEGYADTQEKMDAVNAKELIGIIADQSGLVVNEQKPILETVLPILGFRIEAFIPPIVIAPSFSIRKQSDVLFSLNNYIEQGALTNQQVDIIRGSIHANESLLIAGGPGTGKTTFANALLHEMTVLCDPNQRFIVIEDTSELKCAAPNTLFLKTSEFVDHETLLKASLRASPDKIIVGECRGKETFTLLKAWNTGTKGGVATIHSNNARSSLQRILDMAQETGYSPSPYLICESIDMIIVLDINSRGQRYIKEIAQVIGYKDGEYELQYC